MKDPLLCCTIAILLSLAVGCSSGGGSTALAPNFSLSSSVTSLTVTVGATGNFKVSLAALNGFSGSATIAIAGAPSGVTLTPGPTFTIASGSPQTVQVMASSDATAGNYPLTITGTSGDISHTQVINLSLQAALPTTPLPSRADFVRTDDSPGAIVYDQAHQRVYVANPFLGTVDVVSSTTYKTLSTIPVPGPVSLDITPDGSTVFIGTTTEAVFALDTTTMAIVGRYLVSQGGFSSFLDVYQSGQAVMAAADGSALISAGPNLIQWFPATNSATVFAGTGVQFGYGFNYPTARSGDRTRIIASDYFEPSTVQLFDATSHSVLATTTFQNFAYSVAASPDGQHFAVAVAVEENIYLLDHNLNIVASTPGGGSLLWSVDGNPSTSAEPWAQFPS